MPAIEDSKLSIAADGFLITSRKPEDIDQFTAALIEMVESR